MTDFPTRTVLITSGGTRAPLDDVRWIGNRSTGRFGGQIARECLASGAHVILLRSVDAWRPWSAPLDLREDIPTQLSALDDERQNWVHWKDRFEDHTFESFDSYAGLLEKLLESGSIDIVFLAAAVSDYLPRFQSGKTPSRDEAWNLTLHRAPKLIESVKRWAPGVFQVGFKLESGVDEEELVRRGIRSGTENRNDVTVANDMATIREGRHVIHVLRAGRPAERYVAEDQPARKLVERVLRWYEEEHPR